MVRWHAEEWNGRSRRNSGRKHASGSRSRRSRTPVGSRGIWKTRARTYTISSRRLTSSRHSSRKGPTGPSRDSKEGLKYSRSSPPTHSSPHLAPRWEEPPVKRGGGGGGGGKVLAGGGKSTEGPPGRPGLAFTEP